MGGGGSKIGNDIKSGIVDAGSLIMTGHLPQQVPPPRIVKATLNLAAQTYSSVNSVCLAHAVNNAVANLDSTGGDVVIRNLTITQVATATADCTSNQAITTNMGITEASFKAQLDAFIKSTNKKPGSHVVNTSDIKQVFANNSVQSCVADQFNNLDIVDKVSPNNIYLTGPVDQVSSAIVSKCINNQVMPGSGLTLEQLAQEFAKTAEVNPDSAVGRQMMCEAYNDAVWGAIYLGILVFVLLVVRILTSVLLARLLRHRK